MFPEIFGTRNSTLGRCEFPRILRNDKTPYGLTSAIIKASYIILTSDIYIHLHITEVSEYKQAHSLKHSHFY